MATPPTRRSSGAARPWMSGIHGRIVATCAVRAWRARVSPPRPPRLAHTRHPTGTRMISATANDVEGVAFLCEDIDACERVLTPEAVEFVAKLHRRFNPRRVELLERRAERQALIDSGALPDFWHATEEVRTGDWKVG